MRLKTLLTALVLGAALLLASALAYHTEAAAVWTSAARSLPVYSVERGDNKIAISFDCAWGTEHTDAILSALSQGGVRATFFTVSFWAEKYPEYLKKIDEAGHEVGTHSATHAHMSQQSEGEIREELSRSSAAITAVTGKPVTLFRPPFGDYDNLLIDTSNAMGLLPVQWDVDSLDWKDLSAKEIADRILSRVRSGSIILCHNNGLHTAEALPIVIDALHARGYTFLPVGELVLPEPYRIDATGRQIPLG